MSPAQLERLQQLAGDPPESFAGDASAEPAVFKLMSTLGSAIGATQSNPEATERRVLEFLADAWSVPYAADDPISDLEDHVFFHFSEQGAAHLLPTWRVAALVTGANRPSPHRNDILFLEYMADRLIANEQARLAMRSEWTSGHDRRLGVDALLLAVDAELKAIRQHPHLVRPTLDLCLVVALAGGGISTEETALFRRLAAALNLSSQQAELAFALVETIFWRQMAAVSRYAAEDPERVRRGAILAAYATLQELGTVQGLEHEVLQREFSGLQALLADPDFHHGLDGWRHRGFLWPIGFVAGFGQYLRARLTHQAHHHVAAVAYLAYARQKEPAALSDHC